MRASASAVGTAFPSTIAVTNAGSLPITRVPSRKLPAARASASGPASAAAAARAAARRWGTWLIAAGHAVATRPTGVRAVRVPLERAALLAVGRAGGAITGRPAAFVEGWVPDAG